MLQKIMDTTTHVAGPAVEIRRRKIQRCAVCGAKLGDSADKDLQAFWSEGELVRESYSFLRSVADEYISSKKVPADFCLALVE